MSVIFAVSREAEANVWPVDARWCSWNGLWGGALLGVAVEALERLALKPVRAINAQFLEGVRDKGKLATSPEIRIAGRDVFQAAVDLSFGGKRVLHATAVLGLTPDTLAIPAQAPVAALPGECPPRAWMKPIPGGLQETIETRIAGASETRVLLWTRCLIASGEPLSAAVIAALADHPAYAITLASAGRAFGITLDTSLRFFHSSDDHPGDTWVLLDIAFDGMASNMAMASAHVWCGERLIATCDQTLRLRARSAGPTT